jgi:hypothetical protein
MSRGGASVATAARVRTNRVRADPQAQNLMRMGRELSCDISTPWRRFRQWRSAGAPGARRGSREDGPAVKWPPGDRATVMWISLVVVGLLLVLAGMIALYR